LKKRLTKYSSLFLVFLLINNFNVSAYNPFSIEVDFRNSAGEKIFLSDDISGSLTAKISITGGGAGPYFAALAGYDETGGLNCIKVENIAANGISNVTLIPNYGFANDLTYKAFVFETKDGLKPLLLKPSFIFPGDIVLIDVGKPLPQGGAAITQRNFIDTVNLSTSNTYFKRTPYTTATRETVQNQPFVYAARIKHTVQPAHTYNIQMLIPATQPLSVGDVCLLTFYMKNVSSENESGCATVKAVYQNGLTNDLTESMSQTFTATGQWIKIEYPFTAKTAHTLSQNPRLNLSFGYQPQEILIADPKVTKFPQGTVLSDLPKTEYSYRGRGLSAKWRAEAAARIEKVRKGGFSVNVTDEQGRPVTGAEVSVNMKKHTFSFGTASVNYLLIKDKSDLKYVNYKKYIKELFNKATPESALKPQMWEERIPEYPTAREDALNEIEWLSQNGIDVRGHTVVWERADMLPIDVYNLVYNPNGSLKTSFSEPDKINIKNAMYDYIDDIIGATYPAVKEWDLTNEPVTNSVLRDILGERSLADWFIYVRQNYPDIKLYVNENSIETSMAQKLTGLCDIVGAVVNGGGTVDGIGIQTHIHDMPIAPAAFLRRLDTLGEYAPKLQITEFDCVFDDDELMADQLRDIMTAAFSQPKVEGFIMWGFWDGQQHAGNAPIYDINWQLKPSGQVYKDLVFSQWWTDDEGFTDSEGVFSGRGFYGDYEITVKYGGKEVKTTVTHKTDGDEFDIKI
jgi:GH35 family endo-1,4-beta-xylanase